MRVLWFRVGSMLLLSCCSSCCHSGNGRCRVRYVFCSRSSHGCGRFRSRLAVCLGRRTISRNMTCLTAFIADLASRVERAAIGRSAISGDMAQFATRVAFHSLGLTIACIVVWPAAFVARCSSIVANKSSPETTTAAVATTWSATAAWGPWCRVWIRAAASQMPHLSTRIAATSCSSTTKAESGAISLDVA